MVTPIMTYGQRVEAKVNILAGCLTIFNPSVEVGLGDVSAITLDYLGAYAKEDFLNTGHPFLISMGLFGYRRYIWSDHRVGFFVGGDFGLDLFRMNKSIVPLVAKGSDNGYDVGYGYLLGATIGYKFNLSRRLNLEANLSGGWHYAVHECYTYEGVRVVEFNPSGEWTPYKAGIYLSYMFGS